MPPVKVLVVDDSALMRGLLSRMLGNYQGIQVVGGAVNGKDALEKIKTLKPDAVSLDVEMPVMDGLTALRRIMRECPVPVIMCSSLTDTGTRAAVEALAAGAVDFITKPGSINKLEPVVEELACKIKTAATVKMSRPGVLRPTGIVLPAKTRLHTGGGADLGRRPAAQQSMARHPVRIRLVAIGCSTGGPAALQQVVPALPGNFPVPVVIVQHIPAGFSKPLAEHLNMKSRLEVRHAEDGDLLRAGCVFVAPAGYDITFRERGGGVTVRLDKNGPPLPPGGFRPSADVMMTDAARVYGNHAMGVLMTGMGRDGAKGMKAIKNRHGRTIAEAENSCVVYGMPRAAIEAGAVDRIVPLPQIAQEIINMI